MSDFDIVRAMAVLGAVIFTLGFWLTVAFGLLLVVKAATGTL